MFVILASCAFLYIFNRLHRLNTEISNESVLKIELMQNGYMPIKSSEKAAGFDLFSIENTIIEPYERAVIKTGIKISLPKNTYGRIAPRSGIALKNGIDVLAGVIDQDYSGEIKVILQNLDSKSFQVSQGDRICQLIVERYEENVKIVEVDELEITNRGNGGFGSTGF